MQEASVPTRLLALYTIPKDGLTDEVRAEVALRDDKRCVQSYATALESLTKEQVTERQRTMQCVGTSMQTLEGLDDYHQLAVAQEVQKQAKGEGAEVIGNKPLLLGGEGTLHIGWTRHLANVARMAGFVAKKPGTKDKEKDQPKDTEDERDLHIQRLLEEQAEDLVQMDKQKTERQTRSSPTKEELMERLRKAEKSANQAEKNKKREQLKKQLAALDEESSELYEEERALREVLHRLQAKQGKKWGEPPR